jgi:predicted membrane-bound dolichyl-phosphate-mannose-protein mannosyltransferase
VYIILCYWPFREVHSVYNLQYGRLTEEALPMRICWWVTLCIIAAFALVTLLGNNSLYYYTENEPDRQAIIYISYAKSWSKKSYS